MNIVGDIPQKTYILLRNCEASLLMIGNLKYLRTGAITVRPFEACEDLLVEVAQSRDELDILHTLLFQNHSYFFILLALLKPCVIELCSARIATSMGNDDRILCIFGGMTDGLDLGPVSTNKFKHLADGHRFDVSRYPLFHYVREETGSQRQRE